MKSFPSLRAGARCSLLALCALFSASGLAAETLDRIVAVVNDQVILRSELDSALNDIRRQLQAQGTRAPEASVLEKQVLEKLIVSRLQTQRAKQGGMQVSDDEVNKAIDTIAERNGVNREGLLQALRDDGMDYNAYREQLRDEILMARLRQREVDSRISVNEQDVDLFLEAESRRPSNNREYHLRHILLALPVNADSEMTKARKAEASALLAQLRQSKQQGEDFAALALAKSDGQQALQGGDLGWIADDVLPTVFADIVPRLKTGELSPVLESESGFHIVRLEESRAVADSDPNQELHLRHILIRALSRPADQAAALIAEIHERLLKGEDFTTLAGRYSEDPGSRAEGGDLGWQRPANFDPAFRKQVTGLKDSEISRPFESSYGWHIAQLLARRAAPNAEANSQRDRARASLYQRRVAEEYEVWLRRLRDEAYVELRLADVTAPR